MVSILKAILVSVMFLGSVAFAAPNHKPGHKKNKKFYRYTCTVVDQDGEAFVGKFRSKNRFAAKQRAYEVALEQCADSGAKVCAFTGCKVGIL